MRLKRHREDVKWLKCYPQEKPEAKLVWEIATRYHRLIMAYEHALNTHLWYQSIEDLINDLTPIAKRVLKDNEK